MEQSDYLVVDPLTIKVKEELPRVRKEMGKIKDMVESFRKFGQLQPIVVNRNMELIAGGRRLATCIEAEMQAKIVFVDTVDPLTMREMELEENIQRKALTPAEEILAVQELHNLKRTLHGETIIGKAGGWRIEDTAEIIGRTRTSVMDDLELAKALENFPALIACQSKSEIRKAVKGFERVSESIAALVSFDEKMKDKKDKFEIYNIDALEHMLTMPDKSVHVLMTDPPYGIDIHEKQIALGGHTGGDMTSSGFTYDDDNESAMLKINELAQQSFRFVRDDGFAFVFCAISEFWIVKAIFEAAGWNCSQRPIIWCKNESGQNNAPNKWMSAGYEALLFARKIDSTIVIQGKVDWIQVPNVLPSLRMHQAEKPVVLLKELLSRVTMGGAVVYDPFMGSGSTLQAAIELMLYPIGTDILVESYAITKKRITDYYASKGE